MKKLGIFAIVIVLGLSTGMAANTLSSPEGAPAVPAGSTPETDRAVEFLFRGDMGAEIGLGCSNTTGSSGGPNDWAVGVTATLTPPFGVTSTTYNLFTANGFTAGLNFMAYSGTAASGPVTAIGTAPVAFGAPASYTVAVNPPIIVNAQAFFFGLSQYTTDAAGMRVGMDTGSTGNSWLQAPGCGLSAWGTVDSIGFPGEWVIRAIIDDTVPVELMTFTAE